MERFCRTCLHSIPKDSLFFQLDGQDRSSVALLIKSQLQACVPEVRVGVIKNPVLCNPCLNDLTSAYKFKTKCLETEKQVLDYVLHADSNTTYVDINLLVKNIATKAAQKSKPHTIKSKIRYIASSNNVLDPFTEMISVEDINESIVNGIKKEGKKFPPFTIETVLGDCIDINDSDVEMSETLLPNNNDVKEDYDDIDVVNSLETTASTSIDHIKMLRTFCDNTNSLLKNKKNTRRKRHTKKKPLKCSNSDSDNQKSKESNNIKEISSQLDFVSNKNSSMIKRLNNSDIERNNSEKSEAQSLKTPERTQDASLNNSSEKQISTITNDVPLSDSSILRKRLLPPEESSNKMPPRSESPLLDLPTVIQVKDEVIIKDECEFERHKNKFQEFESYSNPYDEEDQPIFINNTTFDEFEIQNIESSTFSSCSDNFNNEPCYREAKKGCYSCAVCNYSCNSENVLVAHTNMHVNKKLSKYDDDDFMFCGFNREDIINTDCNNCKYARIRNRKLTLLQPKVILAKCKPRLG